jgi:hypothetical protein
VRTKTIITATLWTNHGCSEGVAQNTEKRGRGQDTENTGRAWRANPQGSGACGIALRSAVGRRNHRDGHRDGPQR